VLTMANLPSDERVTKRSPERYITVYALTEPDSGEIRYVGKTEKPPALRLREHSKLPVNDDMLYWIRGLEARGTGPKMEIITCCGQQWWEGEETFWIRWCRKRGANLLNRDPGGVCRDDHGKPNLTGHVKNYIGMKFYGRALVYDRDAGKRRRPIAKFSKSNKGARRAQTCQEVSTSPTLPAPRFYAVSPGLTQIGDAGAVFKRTNKDKLKQFGEKSSQAVVSARVPRW